MGEAGRLLGVSGGGPASVASPLGTRRPTPDAPPATPRLAVALQADP